ncbi:MAG: hypothetical protein ACJAY5_001528 [Actinomycetes bacterium]|jgi:hypothetical protein
MFSAEFSADGVADAAADGSVSGWAELQAVSANDVQIPIITAAFRTPCRPFVSCIWLPSDWRLQVCEH